MSLLSTMALPLRRLQGAKDMPRAPSLPRPRLARHGGWISHHVSLDYGRRGGRAHGEIRRRLQPQRVCLCRSLLTWPLPFWYGSGHSCGRLHNGVCFFWGTKKSPTALDAKRNTSYTRLGTWHVKMWCIQCTSVRNSEWHTLVDISCKFRAGEIV
jgi:hypothetical protein